MNIPKTIIKDTDSTVVLGNAGASEYVIDGIKIEGVHTEVKSWKILKDEAYRPDKGTFVANRFVAKFGSKDFQDSKKCYNLASRNLAAQALLKDINMEYAAVEKAPTYFRERVSPSDFETIALKLTDVRKNNAEESRQLKALSLSYQQQCKNVTDKFKIANDKLMSGVQMKILSIKSTKLPLTLSMAVDAYTPESDKAPSQKQYSSELLVNYKNALLSHFEDWRKANPNDPESNYDIDKIVDENVTK